MFLEIPLYYCGLTSAFTDVSKMADVNTEACIPLVDFDCMSLDQNSLPPDSDSAVKSLAEQVVTAFSTIGFLYLKNHGIPESQIERVRNLSDEFFSLPTETKTCYQRSSNEKNHGWVALEQENLNPERPAGDLKEAFNVTDIKTEDPKVWPIKEVPSFRTETLLFFDMCKELSLRVLKVMGLGLKLKNPEKFVDDHANIGDPSVNVTTLRLLHYPKIPDEAEVVPGQVRCGEHSDYGSITLLFQDNVGGLEVLPVNSDYVPAKPIPGTVVVNIGDLMQMWTADQLVSTKHRVLIPKEEVKRRTVRRSMAFFVHPDNEVMIECLDGTHKYSPCTSFGYLQRRFAVTY